MPDCGNQKKGKKKSTDFSRVLGAGLLFFLFFRGGRPFEERGRFWWPIGRFFFSLLSLVFFTATVSCFHPPSTKREKAPNTHKFFFTKLISSSKNIYLLLGLAVERWKQLKERSSGKIDIARYIYIYSICRAQSFESRNPVPILFSASPDGSIEKLFIRRMLFRSRRKKTPTVHTHSSPLYYSPATSYSSSRSK